MRPRELLGLPPLLLALAPKDAPALYCARTEATNETCTLTLGLSPLFKKTPSFSNALVQSIGGGNTMVLNRLAKDIAATDTSQRLVSHDWWCYQIISGVGGHIIYDPTPCLQYRQHGANMAGSNLSWLARIARIKQLLGGQFKSWNHLNLKILYQHKDILTPQNQKTLISFIKARESHVIGRIQLFRKSGVWRQGRLSHLALVFAMIINKV